MNTTPATPSEIDPGARNADETTNQNTAPTPPLDDDLDFGDVTLGERQPDACSMEEDCERCQ